MKNLHKKFKNEKKEHPWLTTKQAWRIAYDHEKKKKKR